MRGLPIRWKKKELEELRLTLELKKYNWETEK